MHTMRHFITLAEAVAEYPSIVPSSFIDKLVMRIHREQADPPIVFDAVDRSIIDGTHRANATAKQGRRDILAYVGEAERLNPYWTEEVADDEADDE
jgi:hypothetical protein